MPLYEYKCKNCEKMCEFIQSIKEGHKRKCPSCKKFQLKRLPSTRVSAVFKGSGFYETDYKRKR